MITTPRAAIAALLLATSCAATAQPSTELANSFVTRMIDGLTAPAAGAVDPIAIGFFCPDPHGAVSGLLTVTDPRDGSRSAHAAFLSPHLLTLPELKPDYRIDFDGSYSAERLADLAESDGAEIGPNWKAPKAYRDYIQKHATGYTVRINSPDGQLHMIFSVNRSGRIALTMTGGGESTYIRCRATE